MEPSLERPRENAGLARAPARLASAAFWGLADAAYAVCASIAGPRNQFPAEPKIIADSAYDARVAPGGLLRHWPVAALGGLTAFALVMSQVDKPVATSRLVTPSEIAKAATPAPRIRRTPPPAPAELQRELTELAARYREPVGVAVSDVGKGWIASVDGESAFPQQSVSKLWVAITALDAIDRGRMKLDQAITLGPEDRSVFNQPIAYRIEKTGFSTTVQDLLHRALIQSDNAANDKLMATVGGPAAVLDLLRRKDIEGVKLAEDEKHLQAHIAGLTWSPELSPFGAFDQARSRLPRDVREAAMQAYLDHPYDGATPIGIVTALAALKRGELLSKDSTDVILATMAKATTGPRRLRGGLAPGWSIAHKTGTGQDFKGASIGINDVAVLTAPDGHAYTVAVLMRRTAKPVPERLEFMQAVSRAVVEHWQSEYGRGQVTYAQNKARAPATANGD